MPTTHLLYLHGFRSSPQSMKGQKMAARIAARDDGGDGVDAHIDDMLAFLDLRGTVVKSP